MTITVPTKPFRDALARLQPLTTAKASLPALGAVTITCSITELLLSGTNLDQWMTVFVSGFKSKGDRQPFSVSSIDLYNTLRHFEDEDTLLSVKDQFCTVSAGSSTHKMPLITDPLLPMPSPEWGGPFLIEGLPNLLKKCLPFASTDPSRYMLNGVYFSSRGLIAVSGNSLIKIARDITGEANVPSVAAALVAKESGDVTCRFSSGLAEFKGEDWTLTTKLIEGSDGSKYPNCEPLLKCDTKHRLQANRVATIKAAAYAALSLPVHLDTVGVEHGATALRFYSPASTPNPRERTIPATGSQDHSWAVSARKLATALNAFDGESVDMGFTDASSVIIEQGDTFVVQYLCRLGA